MTEQTPIPLVTTADAIGAADRALAHASGGLCTLSARALRMLVEAAQAGESEPE